MRSCSCLLDHATTVELIVMGLNGRIYVNHTVGVNSEQLKVVERVQVEPQHRILAALWSSSLLCRLALRSGGRA